MSFLSIENDEVIALPEAMLLETVKKLYSRITIQGNPGSRLLQIHLLHVQERRHISEHASPAKSCPYLQRDTQAKYEPKEFELNPACKT